MCGYISIMSEKKAEGWNVQYPLKYSITKMAKEPFMHIPSL